MSIEILRTPEERFENLEGYDFSPNYKEISGIRIHYVDEGEGSPILLMHGEPSWSYLYRNMIKKLVKEGFRVIAPDLMGFGKSDKPKNKSAHTYQRHVDIMTELLDRLDLDDTTMFVQDWGGLIGFRIAARRKGRFSRIIAGNTGFPHKGGLSGLFGNLLFKLNIKLKGKVTEKDFMKNPSFINWVSYSQSVEEFPVGEIIQGATIRDLSEEEIKAYEAPFPDEKYKAGPRILPMLVPSQLRKNHKIWNDTYLNWEKPVLLTFSDKDPITAGGDRYLKKIPGTKNQNHTTIKDAGHFLQEDKGDELVDHILNFIRDT